MQFRLNVGLLAVGLFVPCALATLPLETITFSDSVPLMTTSWDETVDIELFDPALGTLESIEFSLFGHIEGSVAFESLDALRATVTTTFSGEISLTRPDLSTLVVVFPEFSTMDDVPAFDGVADFGGTSGMTFDGLSEDASDFIVSPPPASDLTLFTGIGTLSLPVIAEGTSSAMGAGSLLFQAMQEASAEVEVTYTYKPIPEPASMAMLLAGVVLVVQRRRR